MTKVMALCCHHQCLNPQDFLFAPRLTHLIAGHSYRMNMEFGLETNFFFLDGIGATYRNNVSVLVFMGTVSISIIILWIFFFFFKGA